MDLELNEEQKLLKQNARAFMEKEIVPIADEYDRKGLTKEELRFLIRKLIPLGYVTGPLPEKFGGLDLDPYSTAILTEEASRAWYVLGAATGALTTRCERIMFLGTEYQQQRFIPPLTSVDKMICVASSEPNAGSNVAAITTTAIRQGDHYIVNGTKTWCSRAVYADYCLLLTVTDRSKGSRGHSHLLVEKDVSPFQIRPINLMGQRGLGMAELSFQDCKVPANNLLGGHEGGAYKKQLILWQRNRVHLATEAIGVAQAAVDASVKYAKDREQFGKPIGSFQLVQNLIVDMVMKTDAARWLAYHAIAMLEGDQRAIAETCMAKTFATEAAMEVTSSAVEIHGAYGLTEDCPVQRYYRDARCITPTEATSEINRLMIGREILGINAIY